ncbi:MULTISPECIES: protealysin inhibitor emfourin [Micrococcaceae]|uniref:protealysin inhibitor emfourin n=1 Tax=Micrococcaceae TaxID=1268 RepID=UPI000CDCB209|nr:MULTISPECIES: protealysin inhibitor emfourin [Micrococcaceae]HET7782170.1 protealysin inhibitor emfourin [Arthrobacter sp.]AUZ35226.1 hypothetical protein C3B78_12685 [Arthrobacter sp. PGP41]MDT0195838.1 hypothetical protein [Arthrobacter sp. AB6]MEA3549655.1 protealysin inhibitor emfourin [Pseudarthrobacter sp. C1]WPU08037.1 protealysin inhibitor emfourin [Pseudarthrobacter oxydans]
MKISVERTGGIAAIPRVWTVEAQSKSAISQWQPIVEACPWDSVPRTPKAAAEQFAEAQPDRFIYSIRAGQRRAALPEQAVTGPWRILVDSTREAAEEIRAKQRRNGPAPG